MSTDHLLNEAGKISRYFLVEAYLITVFAEVNGNMRETDMVRRALRGFREERDVTLESPSG